MERIYNLFSIQDLQEIRRYSLIELSRFINEAGNPQGKFKILEKDLIAICLCQGAAQHYIESLNDNIKFDRVTDVSIKEIKEKGYKVDKTNRVLSGVKDIDVWFFFKENKSVKISDARNCRKSTNIALTHLGLRRFDFLKKSIKNEIMNKAVKKEPKDIISSYLINDNNDTPSSLALKSIVGLYPETIFNSVIWKVKRLQK